MSTRCEEISQELRKVLNDKDPWVLPIVVLLNTGDAALKSKRPPISTAITEITNGGFHLQVTVNERSGLNAADLRKEMVRALLAERVLRSVEVPVLLWRSTTTTQAAASAAEHFPKRYAHGRGCCAVCASAVG